MEIYPDYRELFALFKAREVRYMVIGSYALGFHGAPRYTGDIDVWVDPTRDNSQRVVGALHDFGFGSLDLGLDTFAAPGVIVQLGRSPIRIDLLTSPSGVEFESCYQNLMVVDVDGFPLNVIGIECFKANKLASGRPKDLSDLSMLP